MTVVRLPTIALVAISTLLASGCCCPMLSGRYCESRQWQPCPQPGSADVCNCPDNSSGSFTHCGLGPQHLPWLARARGLNGQDNAVPSRQHDDYLSPQPKFHPCPTWPVFEPQLTYAQAQLLDPASEAPLASDRVRFLPTRPR